MSRRCPETNQIYDRTNKNGPNLGKKDTGWKRPAVSFVFLCFLILLVFSKFSHLPLSEIWAKFWKPLLALRFVPCFFCFLLSYYVLFHSFPSNSSAKLKLARAFEKMRKMKAHGKFLRVYLSTGNMKI